MVTVLFPQRTIFHVVSKMILFFVTALPVLTVLVDGVTIYPENLTLQHIFAPDSIRTSQNSIIISEVMCNPIGNETAGEWIELFNCGRDLSVEGYVLTDCDGKNNEFVFPAFVMKSNSYVVIYIGTGDNKTAENNTCFYMQSRHPILNNEGDDLVLLNEKREPLFYLHYGSWDCASADPPPENCTAIFSAPEVPEGFSLGIDDAFESFALTFPSPGRANNMPKKYSWHDESSVMITAIYFHTFRNDEFVRITNTGTKPVDISGWVLTDFEGYVMFNTCTVLQPGHTIYIAQNATDFFSSFNFMPDYTYKDYNATNVPALTVLTSAPHFANDGDETVLMDAYRRIVDIVIYGNSDYWGSGWNGQTVPVMPRGYYIVRREFQSVYADTNSSLDWETVRHYKAGQTELGLKKFSINGTVTVFVSPDCSFATLISELRTATKQIFINLYEFTNIYLADELINLSCHGVRITLLIEGSPAGGMTEAELFILAKLARHNISVKMMVHPDKVMARYRYNHAKYAVIDNSTIILTSENWGLTGIPPIPTRGNRGWGLIVRNATLAKYFANIFLNDSRTNFGDVREFNCSHYPANLTYTLHKSEGYYRAVFKPLTLSGIFNITPILGPDNTLSYEPDTLIDTISTAKKSILIEQFYIRKEWAVREGRWYRYIPNAYLTAAISASRHGASVKLLLDSSLYNLNKTNPNDNDDTVQYVNTIAASESLPLEARLVKLEANKLSKLHNKGLIVDGRKVLVSSINWNYNSVAFNREAGLIIENEIIGQYFTDVFMRDWIIDCMAPVAVAGEDRYAVLNESILLDGSGSSDDNEIVNYSWDIDCDGKADVYGEKVWVRFNRSGVFIVTLTVTDSAGNQDRDWLTIIVFEPSSIENTEIEKSSHSVPLRFGLIILQLFLMIIARHKIAD